MRRCFVRAFCFALTAACGGADVGPEFGATATPGTTTPANGATQGDTTATHIIDANASPGSDANAAGSGVDASGDGELTLFVIPPAAHLDWSTPRRLTASFLAASLAGSAQKRRGEVETEHSIGHVHVRLRCGGVDIATTGQTGGGSEAQSVLDGAGALLRTFPGSLDEAAAAESDLAVRAQSGRLSVMKFRVRHEQCAHLRGFLDEYVRSGAYRTYGGQFRPRRFEGAGCSAFSMAFVEVAGLLKRAEYTHDWAHHVPIGLARVSEVIGDGSYSYGSNLQLRSGASFFAWPAGQDIVVKRLPVLPIGGPVLDTWTGPRDGLANRASRTQPDVVPFTIYDPELMDAAVRGIFDRSASSSAGASALGRMWSTSRWLNAPVITADARDGVLQPYFDTVDDLEAK